jgi:hypothetical protein
MPPLAKALSTDMNKYVALIILATFWNQAFACTIPAKGTYWAHDELIDRTETILLVTPKLNGHGFKVLETLKGTVAKELEWRKFRPKDPHRSEDFNGHKNQVFWQ